MKKYLKSLLNSSKTEIVSDFAAVERAERIFYLEYLREGMIVFDVGANVGELTLLFSRFVGESGKVHSFEASSDVFKKLEAVCQNVGNRNVTLNNLALAEKNGEIRLNIYADAYSGFNSRAMRPLENYGLNLQPIDVEITSAVTLDDYCEHNKIEWIDLLKIDVEGAELQVLQGAKRMLRTQKIRCLTFEYGQTTFDMGNNPAEIEKLLGSYKYQIRNLMKGEKTFPGRESVETAKFAMHIATPF